MMSWHKIDKTTQFHIGSIIREKDPSKDSDAQNLLEVDQIDNNSLLVKEIYSNDINKVREERKFRISRKDLIDGNYNILKVRA